MIRWLVRRVVKYVLEELRKTPEFQSLVTRGSGLQAPISVIAEKIPTQAESKENQETQKAIAELMVSRTGNAKVSDIGSIEKIKGDRGSQRAVMDQLKNIGD